MGISLRTLLAADAAVTGIPADGDGVGNAEVVSVTADSRDVSPGVVFAALPGSRFDGARFIPDAVAKGAAAILTTCDAEIGACNVPVFRSPDARRTLALMAARLYGQQPETVVAVTGTSGKTSVADFARQIFTALGCQAASIGTIGVVKPDGGVYGSLTTPDPVTLHRLLAGLAGEGVTHLAFEASSHGLDQRRLDGVRLRAAGFTNLGRDHLDYHATAEDYFDAKLRLFDTLLPADGVAVVNMDDGHAGQVVERAVSRGLRVLGIGQVNNTEADVGVRPDIRDGLVFSIRGGDGFTQQAAFVFDGQEYSARLDLIGAYQVSNVSVAAGLAIAAGEDPGAVVKTLSSMRGVKGRLEVAGRANGAPVVIDYAHKPDALDAALRALRPFVSGRLVCVFGCGGDRDRGKRPLMGGIASALADVVIVTDDNPRTEDAVSIRREILTGAADAREIGDRQDAIAEAIGLAREGDVVLIAGKGHETGQIIGDKVMPFSDHEAVAIALKARA